MGDANLYFVDRKYQQVLAALALFLKPLLTCNLQALRCCEEVIKEAPWSPDPYHMMALIFEEQKEYSKAAKAQALAAQADDQSASHWKHLGTLLKATGVNDKALEAFRRASLLDRDDLEALTDFVSLADQMNLISKVSKDSYRGKLRCECLSMCVEHSQSLAMSGY